MADGSYVAFFDLGDGEITKRDPDTPRWVNHLALEVENEEALETAKARLEAEGVDVLGVTDHGFVKSIYFFDPNDIRLELTCRISEKKDLEKKAAEAHALLAEWTARPGRIAAE